MRESILAFLGLDTGGFDKGIAKANKKLAGVESALSKLGVAGGLFFVVQGFRNILRAADEAEYGVDRNTDAIKRLNAMYSKTGSIAADVGNAVVGSLVRLGEWMADTNSKILFGARQEDLDYIRDAEVRISEEKKKQAEIDARNIARGREAVKIAERLEQDRAKAALNALSDEQKLLAIKEKIEKANATIAEQSKLVGGASKSVDGSSSYAVANAEKERYDLQQQYDQLLRKSHTDQIKAQEEIARMKLEHIRSEMSSEELVASYRAEIVGNEERLLKLRMQGKGLSQEAVTLTKAILDLSKKAGAEEARQQEEQKKQQEAIVSAQKALDEFRSKSQLDELEGREKIDEIDRRIISNQREIERLRSSGAIVEAIGLELKSLELAKKKSDTEKEINRTLKDRQIDLQKEIKSYREIQDAIAQQQRDRVSSSLDEIASGKYGGSGAQRARRVQGMEERAKALAARGKGGEAQEIMDRAKEVRKSINGLSDAEKDPTAMLKQQLEKQQEQVEELKNIVTELQALRTEPVE